MRSISTSTNDRCSNVFLLTVYVFVGDHWALDAFMLCMQEQKLFDNGDYMVIAVNDEFYSPEHKLSHESRPSEFYQLY